MIKYCSKYLQFHQIYLCIVQCCFMVYHLVFVLDTCSKETHIVQFVWEKILNHINLNIILNTINAL